jgi:hypothetical protein
MKIQVSISPTDTISPQDFQILANDQREAILQGGKGIGHDKKFFWKPWGKDYKETPVKVGIWHGMADNLAPAFLAHYIAGQIAGCDAPFYPGIIYPSLQTSM